MISVHLQTLRMSTHAFSLAHENQGNYSSVVDRQVWRVKEGGGGGGGEEGEERERERERERDEK